MIQKFLIFLFIGLGVFTTTIAQKRNIYFLKNSGQEVKLKDSADFIRIIQEPDSISSLFKIFEFYPDNSKKLIGHISSFESDLIYEGPFISFYKSGKKSSQITYISGFPVGMAYYFYPNGKVKSALNYTTIDFKKLKDKSKTNNYELVDYFDSTGVQLVNKGNGHVVVPGSEEGLSEEGNYREGLKDSTWKGISNEAGRYYEEVYRKGVLLSGVQTLPDGSKLQYTKLIEVAQFEGGAQRFYHFLSKNFRYPEDARKSMVSGRTTLSILIKADGKARLTKVSPTLTPSIKEAAYDLMMKSPLWIPAKFRGVPFESTMEVPISLNLSTQ